LETHLSFAKNALVSLKLHSRECLFNFPKGIVDKNLSERRSLIAAWTLFEAQEIRLEGVALLNEAASRIECDRSELGSSSPPGVSLYK
jgi:hypothetical protein